MRMLSLLVASGAALIASPFAQAHVVLSQTSFEAGSKFVAFFKVEHGCDGSPTTALRVQIPDDVTVLETPSKDGWTVTPERANGRIAAIDWRGRLEAGTKDQFGIMLQLPARTGALYFPTVQRCDKGEMRWTEIPVQGQVAKDLKRPAPAVQLIAAQPHDAMYMAGNIMVMQPWSPATPGGAQTGAGYLTIMNHGTTDDTLIGGSTPLAAKLEVHEMSMAGGIMTMRPAPNGVPIPHGATVTLTPQGGYHLMLIGLKAPLKVGTMIPATLNFAKAGSVQVEFTVGALGSTAAPTHNHS